MSNVIPEKFKRHGGPYDRGMADSYYGRSPSPHYFTGPAFFSDKVEEIDMTDEEIAAYNQGYEDNEKMNNHKQWD